MDLAAEIRVLMEGALADFNAGHDYYTDSKLVWRVFQDDARKGKTITSRNLATGVKVNEQPLLSKTQFYATDFLLSFTFQHFTSLFENFLFDALRLWLLAYPKSLPEALVERQEIIAALVDKAPIIEAFVDKELNELKYDDVAKWFVYLEKRVKLGCPTVEEIEKLSEIKATRNILVHNRGIANERYLKKAGKLARCKSGERLEISEIYHRESWELMRKIATDIAVALIEKAEPFSQDTALKIPSA
jgi:hypothetical protein